MVDVASEILTVGIGGYVAVLVVGAAVAGANVCGCDSVDVELVVVDGGVDVMGVGEAVATGGAIVCGGGLMVVVEVVAGARVCKGGDNVVVVVVVVEVVVVVPSDKVVAVSMSLSSISSNGGCLSANMTPNLNQ